MSQNRIPQNSIVVNITRLLCLKNQNINELHYSLLISSLWTTK